MREIAFKNLTSPKNRRKVVAVSERNETLECVTTSHKRFVYVIDHNHTGSQEPLRPEFFINKFQDARQKREKFSFRIKGTLFINRGGKNFCVHYSHSLRVRIDWKTKLPCNSPQPS